MKVAVANNEALLALEALVDAALVGWMLAFAVSVDLLRRLLHRRHHRRLQHVVPEQTDRRDQHLYLPAKQPATVLPPVIAQVGKSKRKFNV